MNIPLAIQMLATITITVDEGTNQEHTGKQKSNWNPAFHFREVYHQQNSQDNTMFEYNISFTVPVNPPSADILLSAAELWTGILRVAATPQEYAPYVSKCEVLSENGHALERKLTMASGAVHKDDGEVMFQDVWVADNLMVEATTKGTGARTTFLLSYNGTAEVSPASTDVSFTVIYELKLEGVEGGSGEAQRIQREYPELARKACTSTVEQIRQKKLDGRLKDWAGAEEHGKSAQGDQLSFRYSVSVRTGKPKGSKCRKTIEREQRAAAAAEAELAISNDTTDSSSPAWPRVPSPPPSGSTVALLDSAANAHAGSLGNDNNAIPDDWLISAFQDPGLFPGELSIPWLNLDTVPCTSLPSTEPLPAATASDLDTSWLPTQETIFSTESTTSSTSSSATTLHSIPTCICLSTLAALASRDPLPPSASCQYDVMLVLVRDFCDACCSFSRCPFCPKDLGSMSLTVITLRILVSSLESATAHLAHTRTRCRATTSASTSTSTSTSTTGTCTPRVAASPSANAADFSGLRAIPASSSSSSASTTKPGIRFQLGLYENQGPGDDGEENTAVLGVLIQHNVRRLLGACWPIWELLRGLQEKLVPEVGGGGGAPKAAMGMGIGTISTAEFAGLSRGLIESQNRLCALLTE
ncbi:SRPBCC family protein [Aspergillus stella-maris]|uniref:SRPBCC family protein n=1 Tax=Aspergillus stella-maris TaxID=1810926 RepID=UPI003CCE20B1